jgi:hypothetical protein
LGIFWSMAKNFLLKLLIYKNFVLFLSTLLVRDLLVFVSILKRDPIAQRLQASHCRRAHDLLIELRNEMRPQILIRLLIAKACARSYLGGMRVMKGLFLCLGGDCSP